MGANSFEILKNVDSTYGVVGRKALNSIFFLLFSSPSLFKFGQHPNVFINLHFNSIHRSGLPLLKGGSSNLKHLNIMGYIIYLQERLSNLYNFSSTLLLKAFWVVIKSLSMLSRSELEFLVLGLVLLFP